MLSHNILAVIGMVKLSFSFLFETQLKLEKANFWKIALAFG